MLRAALTPNSHQVTLGSFQGLGLETFEGWRPHNLSVQPCPQLDSLHHQKDFSHIMSEPSLFCSSWAHIWAGGGCPCGQASPLHSKPENIQFSIQEDGGKHFFFTF